VPNFGTCVWRSAAHWQNLIFSCVETRFFPGSRHCTAVLQTQVLKLCTDLNLSLLYILILGTYSKLARKNYFTSARHLLSATLLERWPHVCRIKITCYRRIFSFPQQIRTTDEYFRFHNKKIDEMRCKLDSTENPHSFEKYPTPP